VAADACQHCGTCYYCTHGLYNICENLAFTGLMNNGAFAELVNVPANLLYKLPANFPAEAGALIEPLAVGMHAVKKPGACWVRTLSWWVRAPLACAPSCAPRLPVRLR
jgi:(R,R)-butanediol dehydrogenase/meso-butanediol dehydrogenase/diacetyl reductase